MSAIRMDIRCSAFSVYVPKEISYSLVMMNSGASSKVW